MKNDDLNLKEKLLAYAFGFGYLALILLGLNFIPYLLYNKAIAPMFGWRTFTFWQIFLLAWAVSWVGSLIFKRGK